MSVNPTQITIHPAAPAQELGKPIFGVRTPGDTDSFAGAPGLSDVVDAINPLHHIPFLSHLYESATGDTASPIAKLAGGALFGGPIGFLLALGDVIFEQQTGHDMAGAAVASLTGSDGADAAKSTAMADASAAATAYAKTADATAPAAAATNGMEILPPQKTASISFDQLNADKIAQRAQDIQMKLASAVSDAGGSPQPYLNDKDSDKDRDVLALFGGQPLSAHKSYQKAQMLPYLNDVNTSMVM